MKFLVAYGTKYGATAGIAERIGAVLMDSGLQAVVSPADQADDPSHYDAIILGSSIYAGAWRKEASEYLERHEAALAKRPVWVFSSGPTGAGDPVALLDGWTFPEGLMPVLERIGPRGIALFHGKIDLNALNIGERLLIRAMRGTVGDFRDWDMITRWASAIAGQDQRASLASNIGVKSWSVGT